MEAALSWAPRYLNQRPPVMRVVQTVARFRSIGYERHDRPPAAQARGDGPAYQPRRARRDRQPG